MAAAVGAVAETVGAGGGIFAAIGRLRPLLTRVFSGAKAEEAAVAVTKATGIRATAAQMPAKLWALVKKDPLSAALIALTLISYDDDGEATVDALAAADQRVASMVAQRRIKIDQVEPAAVANQLSLTDDYALITRVMRNLNIDFNTLFDLWQVMQLPQAHFDGYLTFVQTYSSVMGEDAPRSRFLP